MGTVETPQGSLPPLRALLPLLKERAQHSGCLTREDGLGAAAVEGQRPADCGMASSLESSQPIKALMGLMISEVPREKLD